MRNQLPTWMEKSIGHVAVEQILSSNNAMSPMAMGFDPGTSRIVSHRSFNWANNRVVIFNLRLSCFRNTTDTIVSNTKHIDITVNIYDIMFFEELSFQKILIRNYYLLFFTCPKTSKPRKSTCTSWSCQFHTAGNIARDSVRLYIFFYLLCLSLFFFIKQLVLYHRRSLCFFSILFSPY